MPLPLSVGLPDADEQVGTPATGSTLTPDTDQTNDKDMGAPMPTSVVDPVRAAARASLKLLLRNGGLLLLTLWCVSMWLFGSNYGAQNRIHRLNVGCRGLAEAWRLTAGRCAGSRGRGFRGRAARCGARRQWPTRCSGVHGYGVGGRRARCVEGGLLGGDHGQRGVDRGEPTIQLLTTPAT